MYGFDPTILYLDIYPKEIEIRAEGQNEDYILPKKIRDNLNKFCYIQAMEGYTT